MQIFIESIEKGIWDAIVNGPYTPKCVVENKQVDKPWSEWSDDERRRAQYDCNAKNIITSSLSMDEFFRVSQCKNARKHALIQEYELFKMQKGESIAEVQKRFTHIVNHLMGLGKEFDKEELNIKVLKCLDRNWQPKVTAISESKHLSIITIVALFGKLREHEIEMQRLSELETSEKKVKPIA